MNMKKSLWEWVGVQVSVWQGGGGRGELKTEIRSKDMVTLMGVGNLGRVGEGGKG